MGFLGINLPTCISFYHRNFIRTQLIRSNRAIKAIMSDFLQAWEISSYVPVRYYLVMETCDSTYISAYGSKRYNLVSLGSNFWSLFFLHPDILSGCFRTATHRQCKCWFSPFWETLGKLKFRCPIRVSHSDLGWPRPAKAWSRAWDSNQRLGWVTAVTAPDSSHSTSGQWQGSWPFYFYPPKNGNSEASVY